MTPENRSNGEELSPAVFIGFVESHSVPEFVEHSSPDSHPALETAARSATYAVRPDVARRQKIDEVIFQVDSDPNNPMFATASHIAFRYEGRKLFSVRCDHVSQVFGMTFGESAVGPVHSEVMHSPRNSLTWISEKETDGSLTRRP